MLFTDLSTDRIVRAFKKSGFHIVSEGKHTCMSDGYHHLTIPRHSRINPYTLKGIIKNAGLSDQRFKELL